MILTCQFSAAYPVNFSPSPAFWFIWGIAVSALKRVNWRRIGKPRQFKHIFFGYKELTKVDVHVDVLDMLVLCHLSCDFVSNLCTGTKSPVSSMFSSGNKHGIAVC